MKKRINELKAWHKECEDIVREKKETLEAITEAREEDFKLNVIPDIVEQFGSFLYTSLGERVTGQRSSVLNEKYFKENEDGKRVVELAKDKNRTIDEQLKINASGYYSNRIYSHLTAGRKFGLSYYANGGKRMQTKYFESQHCFKMLTQEHVDCVKNKHKKECVQDFLNYRNEFVEKLNAFDEVVPVNIPVDIGLISKVTNSKKISIGYNDRRSSDTYTIMEGIDKDVITNIVLKMINVPIWNGSNHLGRNEFDSHYSTDMFKNHISVSFLNVKNKRATVYGNIDIDNSGVYHYMSNLMDENTSSLIKHCPTFNSGGYHYGRSISSVNIIDDRFSKYEETTAGGIILNVEDLYNNPDVQKELDKRMDFYKTYSNKLTELKHHYADLYFINADI